MTKDGRPSLITDIRLFAGDQSSYSYLKEQEEAVAFGRRMAWFLNSESFSLGPFPALYVLFTPSLEPGAIQVTNDQVEWWHRYVHVGVTGDFPNVPDTPEILRFGIVEALLAIRPDQADTIRRAEAVVREQGDRLRFLLKRRETKKVIEEISFNIEAWPKPSCLFISHTDKATGSYTEADPITLGFYDEGFDLVGSIRLQDAINLEAKEQRPMMSKVVKRRG